MGQKETSSTSLTRRRGPQPSDVRWPTVGAVFVAGRPLARSRAKWVAQCFRLLRYEHPQVGIVLGNKLMR
jgi:hypothetical protein